MFAAGQAGASSVDPNALSEGLEQARSAAATAGSIQEGQVEPGLEAAVAAVEAAIDRHDSLPGLGPATASEVLSAMLDGEGAGTGPSMLATALDRIREHGASAVAEANAEGGPGNSENAPGHEDGPGASDNAPGQSDDNNPPGQDENDPPPGLDNADPPGLAEDTTTTVSADDGSSADTTTTTSFPGNSGSTPAVTRPTPPPHP